MIVTTALKKITKQLSEALKRTHIIVGGAGSGKTISVLIILVNHCLVASNKKVLVASYELTKMRNTVIKDFIIVMKAFNKWDDNKWNASYNTYRFESGSELIFMPADQSDVGKGLRSDVVYFNECDKIPFENFHSIFSRANKRIIDYNPTSRTYIEKDIMNDLDCNFLRLTFNDNEALGEAERETILSYKIKADAGSKFYANKWRVFGLGEHGISEGNIFDFDIIDSIPDGSKLIGHGLDFGFTNDPSACVSAYEYNGDFILNQLIYKKGMTNNALAIELKPVVLKDILICDSSEPKSIEEIRRYGISAVACVKGAGSVNYGIQLLQSKKIKITKHSYDVIKEFEGYCWLKDKRTGEILNIPQEHDNHSIDASRYAVSRYKQGGSKNNAYI